MSEWNTYAYHATQAWLEDPGEPETELCPDCGEERTEDHICSED